ALFRQTFQGTVDQLQRRPPALQLARQFHAPVLTPGQQIHGCPPHGGGRVEDNWHELSAYSSASTKSSAAAVAALALVGATSSLSRICFSMALPISGLSSRNLAALALPWPILLPWELYQPPAFSRKPCCTPRSTTSPLW